MKDDGFVQILGIRFFNGDVELIAEEILKHGGTIVIPAAPALTKLPVETEQYRQAMTRADFAIADSGAMVVFWKLLRGETLVRISGLKYFQYLWANFLIGELARVLWVVPSETSRRKTARWLAKNGLTFHNRDFYVAPFYPTLVEDEQLLAQIESSRYRHVVIGIGNGPQEKLGYFLRENLSYRPAIHCIGAALGFLTGDQVAIPRWADRFYLGWVFRLFAQPRIFIPRLTRALELPWLIFRYGSDLPPLSK